MKRLPFLFFGSLFIFSLALLIAVTLFPSNQIWRASGRAQQQPSQMCDTSSWFYKKPTEEEPNIDPSSIADLLRSIAFLFFCRSTLIYIGLHHRLSVYRINKTQTHIKLFFYTGKISIYYDERERGSLLCFKRYCECLGLNIR
jgi:hypothetical protein